MLKIKVNEGLEDIKLKLSSIKSQVCIVHNRREKNEFIVTSNSNLAFIQTQLSVLETEDFTEKDKADFFFSDEDLLLIGRADFLQ